MKGLLLSSLIGAAVAAILDQVVANSDYEWFKAAVKSIIALSLGIIIELMP